jgi:N-acetyl-1-D-myo-inositol-2-amino-2-deoxy-alpha-D-glucopyranoside deacetylase
MSELRLLTVHAHPDDESITMGGLLALCADRGVQTSLVCCTDGKLATIFDPEYAADEPAVRPRLKEIREQELRDAAAILGIADVQFLEYGDSGMAGADTNDLPDAFWKADLDAVVRKLVAHIRAFRPHVVVTYDGNGGYGHPDHIQTHRATLLAVEAARTVLLPELGEGWEVSKLYYTLFPRSSAIKATEMARDAGMDPPFGDAKIEDLTFLAPDEWVTTVINHREQVPRKLAAMRAHRSQLTEAEFPLLRIPEDVVREMWSDEHFHLAFSRVPTTLPESDVFAGLEQPALSS